ncbi:uncharacterized protein CPUR_01693 [Claviceps purpurea 20.1]|uniref:Uncharacterized protein n=1 Tax=Claviceps purpurea (strain 20.1) TaxID=1111077 RepID=M1WBD2_CLAP2|nr:uncharacterized protein CPUR_01693 [Claviceps purpurea 20.1]
MRTGFDAEGDPEGKEGVLQTGKFHFRARLCGISRLGGSWDEKKKEQWENDEDPPGVGEVEAMTPTPHEPPTPYSEMEEVTPTPQQEADVETPTSPS